MCDKSELEQVCETYLPNVISYIRRYIEDEKVVGEICEWCLNMCLQETPKVKKLVGSLKIQMTLYAKKAIQNYLINYRSNEQESSSNSAHFKGVVGR